MQRNLLLFTILAALMVWSGGCVAIAPTFDQAITSVPAYDLSHLIADLQASGGSVGMAGTARSDYFSVDRHDLTVNGAQLALFEFPDVATAVVESTYVSADGYNLSIPDPTNPNSTIEMHVDWIDSPHFYRHGSLIVQYFGSDASLISTLERLLGPQFAGAPLPTARDVPSDEVTNLLDELRAAEVNVELGEPFDPRMFTATGHTIKVNGALVAITEFADEATATTETAYIRLGGDGMKRPDPDNPQSTIVVSWEPAGTPHWFGRGRFAANYSGDSLPIIQALETVFGPQFAGGPQLEADAIPSHFNLTWTLPAPFENWVGDVRVPPAWLGARGDAAIPGSYGSNEIRNKAQGIVAHADGVPPQMVGDDLKRVTVQLDEPATVIVFIEYSSIRSIRATIQPWTDELFFDPEAGRKLTGEGGHVGDFFSYVLEPVGEAGDLLLSVRIDFDNDRAAGHATYIWRLDSSQKALSDTSRYSSHFGPKQGQTGSGPVLVQQSKAQIVSINPKIAMT